MFYFFLSLIINLFIIYLVYKKLNRKIEDIPRIDTSEINSLMVEFNKLTKNNIDLLEEKINEVKSTLILAENKLKELKNTQSEKSKKKKQKNRGKYETIIELHKKGIKEENIAKELGISVEEVKLFLSLNKKKRSR